MIRPLISILVLLSLATHSQAGDLRCEALFNDVQLVYNFNAEVPADQYDQNNLRSFTHYLSFFKPDLEEHLKQLTQDDLYIDSATGIGVAAKTISTLTPAEVVAINPQDYSAYFTPLLQLEGQLSEVIQSPDTQVVRDYSRAPGIIELKGFKLANGTWLSYKMIVAAAYFLQLTIRQLPTELDRLPTELDRRTTSYDSHFDSEVKAALEGLLKKAIPLIRAAQEKVRYELGLSENILEKYHGQASLITDLWGAYVYSPNRLKVLKSFYNALKVGGKAYVFFGRQSDHSPYRHDEVQLSSTPGEAMSLIDWLITCYPEIFSYTPERHLVIAKNSDDPFPTIEQDLRLIKETYYEIDKGGFAIPKLIFRVRQP